MLSIYLSIYLSTNPDAQIPSIHPSFCWEDTDGVHSNQVLGMQADKYSFKLHNYFVDCL